MRTIGRVTTIVGAALAVGIRSVPDVKRYLRIRQM